MNDQEQNLREQMNENELYRLREELRENESHLRTIRTFVVAGFSLLAFIALLLFINGLIVHRTTGITELENQVFTNQINNQR